MQQLRIKSKLAALAAAAALAGPATTWADDGCHLGKGAMHNAAITGAMSRPSSGDGMMGVGYESRQGGARADHASRHGAGAPTLVDVAAAAGNLQTLIAAVEAAGLAETLAGEGPYTILAPTDEAFASLPDGTLQALLADKAELSRILAYHVVPGRLDARAVGAASTLSTVAGSRLPVARLKIARTDLMAGNGVVHVIDVVLIPES